MNILQTGTSDVFLCKPVNSRYTFDNTQNTYNINMTPDEVIIPTNLLTDGASILMIIQDDGTSVVYKDFVVAAVDRIDEHFGSFLAYFTSDLLSEHKWSADAKVTIFITNKDYCENIEINFIVKEYSENWIFTDTVVFEQV